MWSYHKHKFCYEVFVRPKEGGPIRIWHYRMSPENREKAINLAHAVSAWSQIRVEVWDSMDDILAAFVNGIEVSTHAQRGYE